MRPLAELREDARIIFLAGVKAADPISAINRNVQVDAGALCVREKRYRLTDYERIQLVGAGKAAAPMAFALEQIVGEQLHRGVVNVKYGHTLPLRTSKIHEAGHPVPDGSGVAGTAEIMSRVAAAGEKDLILFVLSGGASALLCAPAAGLTVSEKQRCTEVLLSCGATIEEVNAIRKHLSQVKGGRLAHLSYPATLLALIVSDVIGDRLEVIGSGPTAPDTSTFSECLAIVERFQLQKQIPDAVYRVLQRGAMGAIPETPKPGDTIFTHVQNLIIANNSLALTGAKHKAEGLGYNALILGDAFSGEAKEVARVHTAVARAIVNGNGPIPRPACLISGGETTVTIRGAGLGGRNQEFALAAAIEVGGYEAVVILSGGTDGTDGPTGAAGGVVDGTTLERSRAKGLDAHKFLLDNDSYHFLESVGDLLTTGPTLTNVMDLRVVLIH